MPIREADTNDWPAIWPFFHAIVAAGETFTYPTDLGEDQGREWWLLPPPDRTVVAVDGSGAVLGTAKMNRNHMGNASHIASASYMVDPAHAGRGVGRALCEHTLEWARAAGPPVHGGAEVVDHDLRAVPGQFEGVPAADAVGGAGHDGDPVLEQTGHGRLLRTVVH
ncbi:GNAT family N-acetyltransferase [Thermomonospora amylolytica]|uniref:GNAT family N-acetyltransferase n=1 Tax=Thermomonospora amylolytica TaxID=1411117 RepID=UPI000E6D4831